MINDSKSNLMGLRMDTNKSAGITLLILFAGIVNVGVSGEEKQEIEWGKEVDGCRFAITPSQPSYRYDQPVNLRMTIKNFGKRVVHMEKGSVMLCYRFDVRLPNGKPAPLTLEGNRQVATTGLQVRLDKLEAGKSDTVYSPLMLNRIYDMTLRGEYTVTVYRKVIVSRPDTKPEMGEVPSNTLKIEVHDRPAEKPDESDESQ